MGPHPGPSRVDPPHAASLVVPSLDARVTFVFGVAKNDD